MKMEAKTREKIVRDASLSLLIYALPVALMFLSLSISGKRPWSQPVQPAISNHWLNVLHNLDGYGLAVFMVLLGILEFSFGLYEKRWTRNERRTDLVCFVAPFFTVGPFFAYFGSKVLPLILPGLKNRFEWVPFFWGFIIICVADDLTQYWYHRLHHQVPWLWRFHRTHHSAPYMGMAMNNRQNLIYTIFFSQIYLTIALVYVGLGVPAVAALFLKSIITTLAHSSIPWDKPFYTHRILHPVAWVLERLISTPATHHAHHADTTDDGVGHYKGNFGNMFFLWDIIFGTGIITRQYPKSYGISHYARDEWYAQFLWPIFKSSVKGSELAPGGPMVKEDTGAAQTFGSFKPELN
jgi:sterol desaturase/sphingolipid hydroxylase (fatty acid hydroxylase superfamily)